MQNDNTKPVPKETPITDNQSPKKDASAPVQQAPVQPSQEAKQVNPTQTIAQPTQPAQPQQQVQTPPPTQVAQEKPKESKPKKKGFCNLTTCLLGGCGGCLLLIIILVLLAIFAGSTLSKYLNKFINPDIEVPELTDVDTTELDAELSGLSLLEEEKTLTVTEEEFNYKLNEKDSAQEYELTERIDFEKDLANLYMKLTEWMPWVTMTFANDVNGAVTLESTKLGTIDVSNFTSSYLDQGAGYTSDSSSQSFDFNSFCEYVLFEEGTSNVQIEQIYFQKDKVELVIAPTDFLPEELEEYVE